MKIYTDGSADLNKNIGGFAIVVCDDIDNILYTIGKRYSNRRYTNNIGELSAILVSLYLFGKQPDVTVYSDSSYAISTFSSWCFSWRERGWLKSDNKPPENLQIIKEYLDLIDQGYKVKLKKVKGHSDCIGNQIADSIAKNERKPDIEL